MLNVESLASAERAVIAPCDAYDTAELDLLHHSLVA
jgi:hypothetical protein